MKFTFHVWFASSTTLQWWEYGGTNWKVDGFIFIKLYNVIASCTSSSNQWTRVYNTKRNMIGRGFTFIDSLWFILQPKLYVEWYVLKVLHIVIHWLDSSFIHIPVAHSVGERSYILLVSFLLVQNHEYVHEQHEKHESSNTAENIFFILLSHYFFDC